ncbi:MAG: BrnT family toxin [Patescibacteria group bacterium]
MGTLFKKLQGFLWDTGNINKNWAKHRITNREAEEIFFDKHYMILNDKLHSGKELRYNIIGLTENGKLLSVAFTIRHYLVRVISTRPAGKRERNIYEKTSKIA